MKFTEEELEKKALTELLYRNKCQVFYTKNLTYKEKALPLYNESSRANTQNHYNAARR